MPEWRFVVAAYVVTWVVLLGYALRLVRVRRRSDDLFTDVLHQNPESRT
jgi:CcmD family protein